MSDDEDVIDADSKKDERYDGVSCRIKQTKQGTDAVAKNHSHEHTEKSMKLVSTILTLLGRGEVFWGDQEGVG